MLDIFLIPILKIVVLLIVIIPVAIPFLILMERKVMAWIQSRLGPMRVGPQGILQAIVDPIKLILKEDITPLWVRIARGTTAVSRGRGSAARCVSSRPCWQRAS